jgi:hypothetical protein
MWHSSRSPTIWEVRRSQGDDCSVWGLFDHTLGPHGHSHQFLYGARRIPWRGLFRQVLKGLTGGKPAAAILLRQSYQVPTGYQQNIIEVTVDGDRLGLEIILDLGGDEIIEAFVGRGGSDPDDVPDLLWFPRKEADDEMLSGSAALLGAFGNPPEGLSHFLPMQAPGKGGKWAELVRESTVAIMANGHLYLLGCCESDAQIERTILDAAASAGIQVPLPCPAFEDDDPLVNYLSV